MKVILKDGSSKEYEQAMPIIDIAKDISEGLARVACVAELDGETVDLRTVVDGEHELNILTFDSPEGKAAYRHTASHVLAQAIKSGYDTCVLPESNRQSIVKSGNLDLSKVKLIGVKHVREIMEII